MLNDLLLQRVAERAAIKADPDHNRAQWARLISACLPFADAATTELPLGRLLAAFSVPGLGRDDDRAC